MKGLIKGDVFEMDLKINRYHIADRSRRKILQAEGTAWAKAWHQESTWNLKAVPWDSLWTHRLPLLTWAYWIRISKQETQGSKSPSTHDSYTSILAVPGLGLGQEAFLGTKAKEVLPGTCRTTSDCLLNLCSWGVSTSFKSQPCSVDQCYKKWIQLFPTLAVRWN